MKNKKETDKYNKLLPINFEMEEKKEAEWQEQDTINKKMAKEFKTVKGKSIQKRSLDPVTIGILKTISLWMLDNFLKPIIKVLRKWIINKFKKIKKYNIAEKLTQTENKLGNNHKLNPKTKWNLSCKINETDKVIVSSKNNNVESSIIESKINEKFDSSIRNKINQQDPQPSTSGYKPSSPQI